MARATSPKNFPLSEKRSIETDVSLRRIRSSVPPDRGRVMKWVSTNRHNLGLGIGVGGLVCVLVFGGVLYRNYRQKVGLERLRSAVIVLQSGNAAEAVPQLEAAKKLVSTEARDLTLVYLGEAYLRLEKSDDAQI